MRQPEHLRTSPAEALPAAAALSTAGLQKALPQAVVEQARGIPCRT